MQSNPSHIIELRINAKLRRLLELQRIHANILFCDGEGHEGQEGEEQEGGEGPKKNSTMGTSTSLLKSAIPKISEDLLHSIHEDQQLLLSIMRPLSPGTTSATTTNHMLLHGGDAVVGDIGKKRQGNLMGDEMPPLLLPSANISRPSSFASNGQISSYYSGRKRTNAGDLSSLVMSHGICSQQDKELNDHFTKNDKTSSSLDNKKRRFAKGDVEQWDKKDEDRRTSIDEKDDEHTTPTCTTTSTSKFDGLLLPSLANGDLRQTWSFSFPSNLSSAGIDPSSSSTQLVRNQEVSNMIPPFASSLKEKANTTTTTTSSSSSSSRGCSTSSSTTTPQAAPDLWKKGIDGLLAERDSNIPSTSKCETTSLEGKPSVGTAKKSNKEGKSFLSLGVEQDQFRLSKFLCFLRSECIEVFTATEDNVHERMSSKKVMLGQVGVRCRFCAHLPSCKRVGRSSNYPSSIDRLYQGVSMMIYKHFPFCEEMPLEVQQKYSLLRNSTKKGDVESRSYWISSAKEKGLIDCGDEGIRLKSSDSDNKS